jgi:diguanylate cyclase (GGDEF)-like protein
MGFPGRGGRVGLRMPRRREPPEMTPELEQQLKNIVTFPTPPGVATHIIELAQDPNIEMGKVAKTVSMDPALTSKILRIANSAMYAQRRRSENLRQALVVLGLNATLTLALSFSLVKALKGGKPNGINYPHYWRRALLSGMAARALGEVAGQSLAEDLFLAGLLQDIGMLALDRGVPDLYRDTAELQLNHRELSLHERKRLGCDHAEVGAWLMRKWNLAERLWKSIQASHRIETRRALDMEDGFNRCVALSGTIADLFLSNAEERGNAINEFAQQLDRIFGLDKEACGRVLQRISSLVPETETIFETDIAGDTDGLIEQAREILMVRNLHTLREVNTLRVAADSLSARAMELEAETRRDALTGVFNRSFLEQYLGREFENATRQGWPLSIAFCDLDHFKKVNDTHGHQAGDKVLQSLARILRSNSRDSDVVARYGGEEFVLVLPATDADTCRSICERIIGACQLARHDVGATGITVTLSIGFATHCAETPFDGVESLVGSADQALYTAKLQGRNRAVRFELPRRKPMVRFL